MVDLSRGTALGGRSVTWDCPWWYSYYGGLSLVVDLSCGTALGGDLSWGTALGHVAVRVTGLPWVIDLS